MLTVGAVADPLQAPSGELAFEHVDEFQPEPRPVERRRNTLCPLGKTKLAKLEQTRLRSRPLSHPDPNQAAVADSHAFHAPDDGARRAPGFKNQFAEFDSQSPLGPRQIKQLDAVFHDDRMVKSVNQALEAFLKLAEGIEVANRRHSFSSSIRAAFVGMPPGRPVRRSKRHIGCCGARLDSQKPSPSPGLSD